MAPLVSAIREPQGGGSQAFVSDLARGLVSRGHEVHVYAATGSEIPGVTVIDTGVDPDPWPPPCTGPPAGGPRSGRGRDRVCQRLLRCPGDQIRRHPQSRLRRPGDHSRHRIERGCRAHAAPATGRSDRGRAPRGRRQRPGSGRGLRVRVPGGPLGPGRPGRRRPPALRADTLCPLVGRCGGRRCFRAG